MTEGYRGRRVSNIDRNIGDAGPCLEAAVKVPGTCGELVQGTREGVYFHVSCPIDIYSEVEVELDPGMPHLSFPPDVPKAASAMASTLRFLGRSQLGGELRIRSSLPRGKGMASSTADVAGTIIATGLALGQPLELEQVAQLALSIEPSDGCFFPGIVVFDHREGRLYYPLGEPPPINIVVLDFGGEVDTIDFNRRDHSLLLRRLEPQVAEALELVTAGISGGDPKAIGDGAIISAMANQQLLFKPELETVLRLARDVRAAGVNVAHSGTVIGVLLDAKAHDSRAVADFLGRKLPGLERLSLCSLTSGGATP